MSTIADVAKYAGLSPTTVSRVINNHAYVSEEKKKLVLDAMEKLGYVPNSAARTLRNQRTDNIAVLVPRVTNPFFSRLIESMEIVASNFNYQLIICQTLYSVEKELKYLDLLKMRQVDGVIMTSVQNEWSIVAPYLEKGPIVLCNEIEEDAQVPSVNLNQEYGGYMLTKHLLERGYRRIAYCSGGKRSTVAKMREVGFMKALNEYSLTFNENWAFREAYNVEDGRKVVHKLALMPNRPDAIFAGGDEVAAGIISEAKKYGWNVPSDLAVVGFDNQHLSEIIEPTITTVHQPVELIGKKAVEVILENISRKVVEKKENYHFPLELIIRKST